MSRTKAKTGIQYKFIPPGRSIRFAKIGQSFISTYDQQNIAGEIFRQGHKGVTRKAYLVFADTGESLVVTVATISGKPDRPNLPLIKVPGSKRGDRQS